MQCNKFQSTAYETIKAICAVFETLYYIPKTAIKHECIPDTIFMWCLVQTLNKKEVFRIIFIYSSHVEPTLNTRQMQTFRAYCWVAKILLILKINWIKIHQFENSSLSWKSDCFAFLVVFQTEQNRKTTGWSVWHQWHCFNRRWPRYSLEFNGSHNVTNVKLILYLPLVARNHHQHLHTNRLEFKDVL